MSTYIALLRAVNVGGTGKLAMRDLAALCTAAGFRDVRTFIASGNVVFSSRAAEPKVKAALEKRLATHLGKPVGVLVRTAAEMQAVLSANPFAHAAANRTVAIFLDAAPPADALSRVSGLKAERLKVGKREIYVHYGAGMGSSRLRIAAARFGTARNMNTVARLAAMAAGGGAVP